MARGPKHHQKRLSAPSSWCLSKLGGVWAPKVSSGPHKTRESLPLLVLLRNRLKYALNYNEAKMILVQRLIKVDGKIVTNHSYPAGLMDVVQIEKTKENFRLIYDTKGRFALHRISDEEAEYKLLKVKSVAAGPKGVTHCTTHDGRTVRFPHPDVRVNDTIRFNLKTNSAESSSEHSHLKFENGNLCLIVGGNNIGRVGVLGHLEVHQSSHNIAHLTDKEGHKFATRVENVMVIGKGQQRWISLPKGDGVKLDIMQDRAKRMSK